jgi:hypothetical protein
VIPDIKVYAAWSGLIAMPAAKDEIQNRMIVKVIVGILGKLQNLLYNLTISS